jgi:CHASE1-domain containing sensor protein
MSRIVTVILLIILIFVELITVTARGMVRKAALRAKKTELSRAN